MFLLPPAPAACASLCLVAHIPGVCSAAWKKLRLISDGPTFVSRQGKHNAAFQYPIPLFGRTNRHFNTEGGTSAPNSVFRLKFYGFSFTKKQQN